MRIGVTGSRHGMTADQKRIFCALLNQCIFNEDDPLTELHYGDCVGADKEIAEAVIEHDLGAILHCHPATNGKAWDEKWCALTYQDNPGAGIVVYAAKKPLERNTDIVEACDALWAFPRSMEVKGGTWDTIKKGWEANVTVSIIGPECSRFHGEA